MLSVGVFLCVFQICLEGAEPEADTHRQMLLQRAEGVHQ